METYKKKIEELENEISDLRMHMYERFDNLEKEQNEKAFNKILFWTGVSLGAAFILAVYIFLRIFL